MDAILARTDAPIRQARPVRAASGKRRFDLALALALALPVAAVVLVLALALLLVQGRPVFYGSRRMATADRAFTMWKLRTMRCDRDDAGVTAGHKTGRVTPLGGVLRRWRLDELPQLWNILAGDMSFVGPRPPLPETAARFRGLYATVLRSQPGVTGLATLVMHRREPALLAACSTPEEAEAVYERRCLYRKARIDLIYQRRQSRALDLWIILATLGRLAGLR